MTDGSSSWAVSDAGKALLPKAAAQPTSQQPVRWNDMQKPLLAQYPQIGVPNSTANQTFIRALHLAGNDSGKALAVARAVFGR